MIQLSRKDAEKELQLAGEMNPGLWTDHSKNVARAAECIAKRCEEMDAEKAYVCGIMHDIGRRNGIFQMRHIIEGYKYCMQNGWEDIARVCITHSFPVQDITCDVGKVDVTEEDYQTIDQILKTIQYDDYDKLIILCDSLADAKGFCMLEKRFVDVTRRYGVFPFTVDRWNTVFEIKEMFEEKMGCSIYDILPGVKESTFL